MSILERGGNAFDAAVATGFALQIVEPHLNGPGGNLPAILYSKAKDRVEVICGQGPEQAKATIAHYLSEGLDLIPGHGLLVTVIPGPFRSEENTSELQSLMRFSYAVLCLNKQNIEPTYYIL